MAQIHFDDNSSELALDLLYTEFVVREELGQPVSPDQWYERFPEWSEDLRQLFEVHRQVCELDTVKSLSAQGFGPNGTLISRKPSIEPRTLEPGRQVGGYQLVEEIGRGGMGVVYRARQLTLNRDVALKMILSGEFAGGQELVRFQTEAEAAARLLHPHIVQVYEVSAHDRCPFLSMEFVAGGSLEARLNQVRLSPREAAQLLAEAVATTKPAKYFCVPSR